jgi:hypothetical protein
MKDPFVRAVLHAHRWFKEGQLFDRYPNCPAALVRGVELYDGLLNTVQVHDLRADRERADAENAARAQELELGDRMRPSPKTRQPTVRRPRPHR